MKIFNPLIKSMDILKLQQDNRLSDESYLLINRID